MTGFWTITLAVAAGNTITTILYVILKGFFAGLVGED